MTSTSHNFVLVDFHRFKAFRRFTLHLRHFNILVGPNNAGKSTVLVAFRILEAAMRKARQNRPVRVPGPQGTVLGHSIDIRAISVAEENIFHNYDDSQPALIIFNLSNRNSLTLYFPEVGSCYLHVHVPGRVIDSPRLFRLSFDCRVAFVPILGPVEHHEQLYEKETARRSLFTYGAARNFRNIWYHYPENFDAFRGLLRLTWPGMDILPPELDTSHEKPRIHMYCPEQRIPREIFWAGFGFQVWVQMLTYLVQANDAALFLIDEPDIYLHSDLQRQLLGLLRNLGPDILIATHSTEIISEAETDDIVLITKSRPNARRIRDPAQLKDIFRTLGSNLNPILTQVAKSRRVLFVEGKDFQIIGRFAQRQLAASVSNRAEFAVVPVDGFNPERVRNLKAGMEETLGGAIVAALVLDRDYRSEEECGVISAQCRKFCDFVRILQRKEVENFLLVASAIDRAAARRVSDRAARTGTSLQYELSAANLLNDFATTKRSYVASQMLTAKRQFERTNSPNLDETTITQAALEAFEVAWATEGARLSAIPGKEALSVLNRAFQELYGITVTPTSIIDAMRAEEVPREMISLLELLTEFVGTRPND